MDKVSVLYMVDSLEVGGIQRLLLEIVRRLNKDQFRPLVYSFQPGGMLEKDLADAGAIVMGRDFQRRKNPLEIGRAIQHFQGVMQGERVDILHTQNFITHTFGCLPAKLAGVPVVVNTVHSMEVWKKWFHLTIDHLTYKVSDKIIAVSEAVKCHLIEKEGLDPEKIVVIYNGISPEPFQGGVNVEKQRRGLRLDRGSPVVGTVARLVPRKGVQILLEAVPTILAQEPSAHFLFVGDGPLKEQLMHRATQLSVSDRVSFLGTRSDVPELLQIIDLFVLPSSEREGFGLALVEAMAAGKPVVATRLGSIPEVVEEGITGLLVPPGDSRALACAIRAMLEDRERAREMGERGRQRVVARFDIQRTVHELESLYQTLLANTGIRSGR